MKILIVSRSYPPANSPDALRPFYFAKALHEVGWEVSILTSAVRESNNINNDYTQDYAESFKAPFKVQIEDGILIYRIPYHNSWMWYAHRKWIMKTFIWKVIYLIQLVLGRNDQESYNKYFLQYTKKILSTKKFDCIQIIIHPANFLNIVAKEAIKHNIPYVIDFRDYIVQDMALKNQKNVRTSRKLKIFFEKRQIQKYFHKALFCIGVSKEMLKVYDIAEEKQFEILNGYSDMDWKDLYIEPEANKFVISCVGTIYIAGFFDEFLLTFRKFLELNDNLNIEIRFVGLRKNVVIDTVRNALPFDRVSIFSKRYENRLALEYMLKSNVLVYHGWKGYQGIYSLKIFEYLKAQRRILIVPGDDDVIDQLVRKCQAGVSCKDSDEAAATLTEWYKEWTTMGKLECFSIDSQILEYSRTNQARKLVKIYSKIFDFKNHNHSGSGMEVVTSYK